MVANRCKHVKMAQNISLKSNTLHYQKQCQLKCAKAHANEETSSPTLQNMRKQNAANKNLQTPVCHRKTRIEPSTF